MEVLALLVLLLAAAWITGEPFLQSRGKWSEGKTSEDTGEKRERILLEIRELVFDFAAGKIDEKEYANSKAQLVKQLQDLSQEDVRS